MHKQTLAAKLYAGLCDIFFGLINMIVNNCFIIYSHTAKSEGRKILKADFLQDMALSLCKPFALERYEKCGLYLPDDLKDKIKTTFVLGPQGAVADPAEEPFSGRKKGVTKKKCKFDEKGATYSGLDLCHGTQCNHQTICSKHSVLLCKDCYESVKKHL